MPRGPFAQELLLRTSAQARAVCHDKLRQCADGRGDVIVASISPDLEAAQWLCALEEGWNAFRPSRAMPGAKGTSKRDLLQEFRPGYGNGLLEDPIFRHDCHAAPERTSE